MDDELHDKILKYLFELRRDGQLHDLLDNFSHIKKKQLYETVIWLRKSKLIETDKSYQTRNITYGLDKEARQNGEKVNAKISIDGIEHIKKLMEKNDIKQSIVIQGDVEHFQNAGTNTGTMTQSSDSSEIRNPANNSSTPTISNITRTARYIYWTLGFIVTIFSLYQILVFFKIL